MGLRPFKIFYSYSAGIDFRRLNLTSKVDPHAGKVNIVNVYIFMLILNIPSLFKYIMKILSVRIMFNYVWFYMNQPVLHAYIFFITNKSVMTFNCVN